MSSNAPTWTTERLERLKTGFEAGWSCREIAVDIGVSRNAVIGKLSRLNLTREPSGDARPKREKRPPSGRAANPSHGSNTGCCRRCTMDRRPSLSTIRSPARIVAR